jgi:predicted DCC family thiol-disulfide oxidoreductase YuxK
MRPRPPAVVVALFDGDCGVCTASAGWFAARHGAERVERIDLREASAAARFPSLDPDAVRALMHAVDDDGRVWIGLDAVRQVLGALPRWSWAAKLLGLPGIHRLATILYRLFAGRRLFFNRWLPARVRPASCDGDACAIDWEALARSEHQHGS